MEMEDEQAWMQGQYTLAAVMHGLSRLSKKGGKVNYPDKPMLREQAQKRKEEYLTENDKKKQRERLLMSLQIMQINFKNNHKNDEQGG